MVIHEMASADFAWAAKLMEARRARYEAFSPVFWRPAAGVADLHAQFMQATGEREGAVALRTDHGFVLGYPHDGRFFVDDLAVDDDVHWVTEGRELLVAAWEIAQAGGETTARVVTARRDEPKRQMLLAAGLRVAARWWVRELSPTGDATTWGPVTVGGVEALMIPAPPVYNPGGPVCVLGDVAATHAATAAEAAGACGAVLAIVQRDRGVANAPASEPDLDGVGFHNPSEFYDGTPT